MTVRPDYRDQSGARYVLCDGCLMWQVRLDPVEIETWNGDGWESQTIGVLLTEDEGRDYLAEQGWSHTETVDGNIRRDRDLCPRCRKAIPA